MANIRLVLQYDGCEAHVDIPLRVPLCEVLRRVKIKKGPNPHDELAHQMSHEIRDQIQDQRLIRGLLRELVGHLDP